MLVKKPDENDDIQRPFEDNRFMDHVDDHFVNTAAANHYEQQNEHFEDDEPELANKIDFAEKKDYSKFNRRFFLRFIGTIGLCFFLFILKFKTDQHIVFNCSFVFCHYFQFGTSNRYIKYNFINFEIFFLF